MHFSQLIPVVLSWKKVEEMKKKIEKMIIVGVIKASLERSLHWKCKYTHGTVETNTTAAIDAICVQTKSPLIDLWIIIAFMRMSMALQSKQTISYSFSLWMAEELQMKTE